MKSTKLIFALLSATAMLGGSIAHADDKGKSSKLVVAPKKDNDDKGTKDNDDKKNDNGGKDSRDDGCKRSANGGRPRGCTGSP